MIDFTNIEYLKSGNDRQQSAYQTLKKLNVFEELKAYHPLLTGTIPIDIDLPKSDLDIICECTDHKTFANRITELYGGKEAFQIKTYLWKEIITTTAKLKFNNFEIELFGQAIPTQNQLAYRHMIIEYQILIQQGPTFKNKIRQLKETGLKTEPAFTKLLGLNGDPYEALLKYEI